MTQSSKAKVRTVLLSIGVIAVLILLASSLFGGKEEQLAQAPLLNVDVSHPIERKITEWDEFTGRFEASDRVEVRARVSGYIESINFIDGQIVDKGDVLFVIDQRPFLIALKQAQAVYNQAEADYIQAADNFKRIQHLQASGAVSAEEYERRQQATAAAQARVELAQAAIDEAQLNIEFTRVTAPMTGRVGRDLVNRGNLISGGTANSTLLTTVVSTDPIHFYFTASESEFLKYSRLARTGQRGSSRDVPTPIEVKLSDEPDFAHIGHMDFVGNEISRSTGTVEGRAVFDNKDGLLEPGMFGRARLRGRVNYEVLMIPDALINTNQTVKFVYTIAPDSTVQATPIEPGQLYQGKYRIINSGLKSSDQLVISNLMKVRPAAKVAYTSLPLDDAKMTVSN